MKKNLIRIFILTGFISVLSSCGEDKAETGTSKEVKASENTLEGEWKIVKTEGDESLANQVGQIYEFKGNEFAMRTEIAERKGTFKVSGDTISQDADDTQYIFELNGDKLKLSVLETNWVYYLERN